LAITSSSPHMKRIGISDSHNCLLHPETPSPLNLNHLFFNYPSIYPLQHQLYKMILNLHIPTPLTAVNLLTLENISILFNPCLPILIAVEGPGSHYPKADFCTSMYFFSLFFTLFTYFYRHFEEKWVMVLPGGQRWRWGVNFLEVLRWRGYERIIFMDSIYTFFCASRPGGSN